MSTTPRIYVAVSANHGPRSYDGPVSVIGAYSHPAIAKRACQHDAQHGHAATVPPIKWLGGEDAGTYWTDAEPYGYQIVRTGLDAHAGPGSLRCESCGEHIADPHAPDCPEDIEEDAGNPCGVPEADTDENGMTWADRCTAEDPCPVRAAQGGLSCGH